jgi:F-type H+-transporting ATPase subunit b
MLDINPILLLITLAVFIFLVWYLNHKLYVPLLKYMEDRDDMLKGDRESVNQNYSEIDSLRNEAEAILANARKEGAVAKESILSETKATIAKKLEEKKRELEMSFKDFEKSLATERVSLKNHLLADSSAIESALRDRFASI